jgi:hypothetical protein
MTCIRNEEFWSYAPNFVKTNIILQRYGVILIGYFPYHTARIISHNDGYILVPRDFFVDFEKRLYAYHVQDNKAVYICKPIGKFNQGESFAIMFKDSYCIISGWNNVVKYDGKEIHEDQVKHDIPSSLTPMSDNWPCTHCEVPDQDYCLNCCPLKKDDNEKDRKENDSPADKDAGNGTSSSDSKPHEC